VCPQSAGFRTQIATPSRDERAAALAGRQGGRVAWRQLVAIGFDSAAVRRRVASGRLIPTVRGVYAVGHTARGRDTSRWEALLAHGPGAVLSHRTAAAVWGIAGEGRRTEVTVTRRVGAASDDFAVHRTRTLPPADVTHHEGLRLTTVTRTLIDLAPSLTDQRARRTLEEADIRGLLDLSALEQALAQANGRAGTGTLRAVAADLAEPPPTRSELEQRFRELVIAAGLPAPQTNVRVAGLAVDAHWPSARLCVELDGRRYHAVAAAFERDRRRDEQLTLAGQRPLRFTWRRVVREPDEVASTIERLLR